MPFAQVVIGMAGSGKSTFCHGMAMFLNGIERPTKIVNLDPANEHLPYADSSWILLNACDIVNYSEAMHSQCLGPNGALIYCMESIEKQIDSLVSQIQSVPEWDSFYYVIDFPGQLELFSHHTVIRSILSKLEKALSFKFVVVNMVDSTMCADASNFIAATLVSLQTMLNFEYPFVNVLSKIDLCAKNGLNFDFNLEFYAEVQNMKYLCDRMNIKSSRFTKLNEAFCELIEDLGSIVYFVPLAIEDKECMVYLLKQLDKANGFAFGTLNFNDSISEIVSSMQNSVTFAEYIEYIQDKYVSSQRDISTET